MSLKTINQSQLERAIENYTKIMSMVKDAVDIRVNLRMNETMVVGWIFKRRVNTCQYFQDNSFAGGFYTEKYIRAEVTKNLLRKIGILHIEKVSLYQSMVVIDGADPFIQADEEMCNFIDLMIVKTPLVVEKIIANYHDLYRTRHE
ncbi:hypothetical protein [Aeromonas phage AS-szw]|uniref:Uncharacterized protein n=1 Tax=Aeromonas phage AS-szw TaxID=2026114 RepID=A0A291LCX4_9CAUD|nr:hypothetical protein [Aeromonas phage AS-szw]